MRVYTEKPGAKRLDRSAGKTVQASLERSGANVRLVLGMAYSNNIGAGDDSRCLDGLTVEVSAVTRLQVLEPPGSLAAGNQGVLE